MPRSQPMPSMAPLAARTGQTRLEPSAPSWRCIGVSGVADEPTSRPMRPASVEGPVATTIAVPLPPVTTVPR